MAQIVESLGVGGAENLAVRIANALADRGHESHLIVMEGPGPLSPRIAASVHVHYLNYHRVSITNPVAFLISVWQGFRRVSGLLRAQDIQLLQSHLLYFRVYLSIFFYILITLGNIRFRLIIIII